MLISQNDFKVKYLKIFLFLVFITHFYLYKCYSQNTDFDYPIKKRLNNGNYLVMTTQGIYLYNEDFQSKKDILVYDSRAYKVDNNDEAYTSDIAQFSSNNDGYIICLIKNETYIFSKKCILKAHFTLTHVKSRVGNKVIPYKKTENNYYYAIINVEGKNIMVRQYIFNSLSNSISYHNSTSYYVNDFSPESTSISCLLMPYSSSDAITCFFVEWNNVYHVVFDTNTFQIISERGGRIQITNIDGGQNCVANIISDNSEKAVCCIQKEKQLACFVYDITENTFSEAGIVTTTGCKTEPIQIKVEYFPETEEFLVGCKGYGNDFYLGKYSKNYIFSTVDPINNIIPSECNDLNLFNFFYSSSSSKYSIINDATSCQDQRVFSLENVGAVKINDFPSDEPGIEITPTCNGYLTYDNSECYTNIPEGYFHSDTSENIIYPCHSNCKTCEEGPIEGNNNCLTCPSEGTKYLDSGNCVSSCDSGDYFTDPDDESILRCKCSNSKCLYCTPESITNGDLCIICNNQEGYYSKSDETTTIESFIK